MLDTHRCVAVRTWRRLYRPTPASPSAGDPVVSQRHAKKPAVRTALAFAIALASLPAASRIVQLVASNSPPSQRGARGTFAENAQPAQTTKAAKPADTDLA